MWLCVAGYRVPDVTKNVVAHLKGRSVQENISTLEDEATTLSRIVATVLLLLLLLLLLL